jgi:hypothetical protein
MGPRPLPVRLAAAGLLLGLLACAPVFVIGWQEWCILVAVFALLLGPVLFRFWRTWRPRKKK